MKYYLFFLFLMLSSIAATSQNLVTEGSFSASGTGWTFFAPATGIETCNPEKSYGGTGATNTIAEVDLLVNLRQTNISVIPGNSYHLSFRCQRKQTGGIPPQTEVRVKVYNGANVFLSQDMPFTNTSWDWQCKVFQFTPTTSTVSIDFEDLTVNATTEGTLFDDITITPVDQPITLSGNGCRGGAVTLQAPDFPGNPDAVYINHTWSGPNGFTATGPTVTRNNVQPAQYGSYTCTMSLNHCLQVSGTYNLSLSPVPVVINTSICQGTLYDFFGTYLGTPGTYDTLITNNNNLCDSLVTLHLTMKPLPDPDIGAPRTVSFCAGDLLTLKLTNPNAATLYQWMFNGAIIPGETAPQLTTTNPGAYSMVADLNGCRDTSARLLVVEYPVPEARILDKPENPVCASDTLTLSAREGDGYIYWWTPEKPLRTLSSGEGHTVAGIFDKTTTVILTVYNSYGCSDTDTTLVEVVPCCNLLVPNAFSPNGDGLNDYFLPQLAPGQLLVTFQVYSRRGNQVYNNTNGRSGWNGKYANGQPADLGTYMYYMQYTCTDGTLLQEKGNVSLIR